MFGIYTITINFLNGDNYHFEESDPKLAIQTINTELENREIDFNVTLKMMNADECMYVEEEQFSLAMEMELR